MFLSSFPTCHPPGNLEPFLPLSLPPCLSLTLVSTLFAFLFPTCLPWSPSLLCPVSQLCPPLSPSSPPNFVSHFVSQLVSQCISRFVSHFVSQLVFQFVSRSVSLSPTLSPILSPTLSPSLSLVFVFSTIPLCIPFCPAVGLPLCPPLCLPACVPLYPPPCLPSCHPLCLFLCLALCFFFFPLCLQFCPLLCLKLCLPPAASPTLSVILPPRSEFKCGPNMVATRGASHFGIWNPHCCWVAKTGLICGFNRCMCQNLRFTHLDRNMGSALETFSWHCAWCNLDG